MATPAGSRLPETNDGVALRIQKASFTLQYWTRTITIAVIIGFLHLVSNLCQILLLLLLLLDMYIFIHQYIHLYCNKFFKIQILINVLAGPGI